MARTLRHFLEIDRESLAAETFSRVISPTAGADISRRAFRGGLFNALNRDVELEATKLAGCKLPNQRFVLNESRAVLAAQSNLQVDVLSAASIS
jgi:hypothetical protein